MNELGLLGVIFLILLGIGIYELSKMDSRNFVITTNTVHKIDIVNLNFNKPKLFIRRGDTIAFKNFDQVRHTIINDHPHTPNSPLLLQFETWEQTYTETGVYEFHSSLFKNMKPLIVVVEK